MTAPHEPVDFADSAAAAAAARRAADLLAAIIEATQRFADQLAATLAALDPEPVGCGHRFPDGTQCTLSAEVHYEIPSLAAAHHYTPRE